MKILVIQKKRIGDVLTSTILFEALKEKFQTSELYYLIYSNAIDVVTNNPFIDHIIVMDEKERKNKIDFLKFLFFIRKQKFDIVVDAYGKPNSVLMGWFSGAKQTITFKKKYANFLYTDTVKRNENSFSNATKAIEHRMELLKPLGIDFKPIKPLIVLKSIELEQAKSDLQKAKIDIKLPIVMISAVGSNEKKTYPTHYLASLLDTLVSTKKVQILFNYLPHQKDTALEIYKLCNENTKKSIFIDFYTENLRAFLAVTKLCQALIGNEGGATNMAKALNVPTFTIFSPSVPKEDWNMFENETTNISVHCNDYQENKTITNSIEETTSAFDTFKPSLFIDKFIYFINQNIN